MAQPCTLWEALELIPDHRDPSGRRYPLPSILALTVVAFLSGARSVLGVADFGRNRGPAFAAALGFYRGTTPCCTTLHYFFKGLNLEAFECALARWRKHLPWSAVSVDGKTLRGSKEGQVPGQHLLLAYAHQADWVLKQIPVAADTNEHQTALQLLKILPLKDKVLLGDAMFCQRNISQRVIAKGGDYIWPVKENQPAVRADVALLFEAPDFSPV